MPPEPKQAALWYSHATGGLGDDTASLLLSYGVVGQSQPPEMERFGDSSADEQSGATELVAAADDEDRGAAHTSASKRELQPALLNALIVEWVDEENGIARRIDRAVFSEQDWMKLGRDWRRVILQ